MIKFPIALQLYSVRDNIQNDFEGTLKIVKEMGYDGVEFAGLFDKSASEVKEMCKNIGLTPISAHIPLVDMIDNPDLLATYKEIGCEYVVIPYLTEEYRPSGEKFAEVIEAAEMLGKKAKQLGMTLCYHNHDFEFDKIDGKYALDVLYDTVPADLLETELDTCWVNIGGENPSKYILKYKNRSNILHLKDFVGGKSEHMYGLIGLDDNDEATTKGTFDFRPVGSGVQDFPSILKSAEEAGTKWVVVEQDQPSMELTPLECAKKSIEYLKSL